MRTTYPDEIKAFIRENVAGTPNETLSEMIKEKFGIHYTTTQLKWYKKNNKLKSGLKTHYPEKGRLFPKEIRDFIEKNAKGNGNLELTEMINKKFKTDYTMLQVKTFKKNHHISSGLTGQFVSGQLHKYKTPKGFCPKGSEKGWFKKGELPSNLRPVGSERYNSEFGYVMVKTGHPNKWELKHKVLWEKHYGEIPEGYKLMFLDMDRTNVTIENLILVKNDELLMANRKNLRFKDPEATKTGVMLSKLMVKTKQMEKEKQQKV